MTGHRTRLDEQRYAGSRGVARGGAQQSARSWLVHPILKSMALQMQSADMIRLVRCSSLKATAW